MLNGTQTKDPNESRTTGLKSRSQAKNESQSSSEGLKLSGTWHTLLEPETKKEYMKSLRSFLASEIKKGKKIFPRGSQMFNALENTPFEDVKVVIVGQDPYHGPGQAHGLSFSVPDGVPLPPSLQNIFKELKTDLNIDNGKNGNLTPWAESGVLLLNATLSVEMKKAGSHQKKGWEQFTDAIIHKLNEKRENLVFILWGSYAQKKCEFIDRGKHFVIESPHPSPLSAHRGFFGSRPFSKANEYLKRVGSQEINWKL